MSKRLLQRGRYPKGSYFQQPNNEPQQHFPQDGLSNPCSSGLSLFTTTSEQVGLNSGSYVQHQQVAPPPPNPHFSSQSVPWQSEPVYSTAPLPQPTEPWKWNTSNNSVLPDSHLPQQQITQSCQQPPHTASSWQTSQYQFQQPPVSVYNNQPYANFVPDANQMTETMPQANWNITSSDLQNQNCAQPIQHNHHQQWENPPPPPPVSQPEQYPWTYGMQQNYEQSQTNWQSSSVVGNNITTSANTPQWNVQNEAEWPSLTKSQTTKDVERNYLTNFSDNRVHSSNVLLNTTAENSNSNLYLPQNTDSNERVDVSSQNSHSSNSEHYNKDRRDIESESGNGSLSNFFHNDIEDQAESSEIINSSHIDSADISSRIEETNSCLEESMANLRITASVSDSLENERTDYSNSLRIHDYRTSSTFIQNENNGTNLEAAKLETPSLSPILFSDEPLNKEIPEPNDSATPLSGQQEETVKGIVEDCPEEPLNQQVPSETSESTLSAQDRIITFSKEENSFNPVIKQQNEKGIIIQQETNIHCIPYSASKDKENNQEVNLETVPDNLERPPDHEELKKHSLRHRLHTKAQSKDSIPSTSLWDNPDIPCITLAPAAPPLSTSALNISKESRTCDDRENQEESKNDSGFSKNINSDSSNDNVFSQKSSVCSEIALNGTDVSNNSLCHESKEKEIHQSSTKYQKSALASESNTPAFNRNQTTEQKTAYYDDKDVRFSSNIPKESKLVSSVGANTQKYQTSDFERQYYENQEIQPSHFIPTQENAASNFEEKSQMSSYQKPSKLEERRQDESRHRFSESRGGSYDERYYIERDRSRPSSRLSLHEPLQDAVYREKYPPPPYDRPLSRTSETDPYRSSSYGRYPYDQYRPYTREDEYYRRSRDYRGYEYDYYRPPAHPYYYDPYVYGSYNYGFYDELYRNDPRYKEYYKEYYKRLGYDTDYDRSSVHSGRSSANELTKTTQQRYPDSNRDIPETDYQPYNQPYYGYGEAPSHSSDIEPADNNYMMSHNSSIDVADDPSVVSVSSGRLTPLKFSCFHPFARFSSNGFLVTVMPNQASVMQTTPVEIHDIQLVMEKVESYEELKHYQGPLVRGETHKNDVIDFCSEKITQLKERKDIFDRDSYILLWELMVLLLRQNGSVAGTDIAQLLLKDHEILRPPPLKHSAETPVTDSSPADSNEHSNRAPLGDASSPDEGIVVTQDRNMINSSRTIDVVKVTRKFREFLLFGHKKDALEWAMKHGLWGHALFLASKMDLRTYANVMTRFANSLTLNDPLQTLYQLMSGRQPAAVTCVADKQWGDWRPHLAMILSNPSSHSDVDSRSITTLGDTLASRGCLAAAHFCYLMAQVEFGDYSQKSSKLVLLSANHQLPFEEFATNEAIQCTEIYEYAQSLANPGFILNHLQAYKFLYATRLVDHGLLQEALHYCEILSCSFISNPDSFSISLIKGVHELSTRLKYYDPHFLQGQGELEEQDDPEWLQNLTNLLNNLKDGLPVPVKEHEFSSSITNENIEDSNAINEVVPQQSDHENIQETNQLTHQQINYSHRPANKETYQHFNLESREAGIPQQMNYDNNQQIKHEIHHYASSDIQNENYYNQFNQQNYNNTPNAVWAEQGIMPQQQNEIGVYGKSHVSEPPTNHWKSSNEKTSVFEENETMSELSSINQGSRSTFDYYSNSMQQPSHTLRQVSRERTTSTSSTATLPDRRDSNISSGTGYGASITSVGSKTTSNDSIRSEKKEDKTKTQVGKTWLGGIFSRLLPKSPNQMILPDDKNPTIVWDPNKNRWVNTDSNDDDDDNQPIAPPTDVELMSKSSADSSYPPSSLSSPPVASPVNKFQRPKTKGMRQNYVDILNPTSSASKPPAATDLFPPPPPLQPTSTKMFIPSVPHTEENSMDFVNTNQQTGSISTSENESTIPKPPLMFDPAEFDSRRSSITSLRHSVGPARRTYPT